ncbi:unnamed protein product [Rotaria sordida]|uniref:Sushi domain-containing protein n=2 Tax=Rotaria sordida TaxID=392033 RepID=A0A815PTR1_9BILA|nr:unnamed protein product [Rotaria sordida]
MVVRGKCPMAEVSAFINNPTITKTMTIHGKYNLPTDGIDNSTVLTGAYVPMMCNSGYVHTGGQLNITCIDDAWTTFPTCVSITAHDSHMMASSSIVNTVPCALDHTTFNITNGYSPNASLTPMPRWIRFACMVGYTLDPTIGELYTCNNGVWSTKPRCLITGRCSLSELTNFLSKANGLQTTNQSQLMPASQEKDVVANGLQTTNQSQLMQVSQETDVVISGSYIVTICVDGYKNMGGNLNITCSATGSWSLFPKCVMNDGNSGSPTGPAVPPGTSRCSFSELTNFLSKANGLQTTNQSQLMQVSQETDVVISGSYIVTICIDDYRNMGGNLNITCSASGSWSPFPNCVLSAATTISSSNSGSPCNYNSSLLTIPNGVASSSNGLMSPTTSQAVSGAYISYMCTPSYKLVGNSMITCTNGVWSPQPACVASSSGSQTSVKPSAKCTEIPFVGNSDILSATPIQISNNISRRKVEFKCKRGYTYASTSGQLVVWCTNGVWDRLPVCAPSPACSINQLQSALINVVPVSNSLKVGNGGILADGWIQLRCAHGYALRSLPSSLNITCLSTGAWSQFPVCLK